MAGLNDPPTERHIMKNEKNTTLRFKVATLAIFGDHENGRESERGVFTINGEMFMSMEPVSRQHATDINREMTALRKVLDL
jgi:hypothetical protein